MAYNRNYDDKFKASMVALLIAEGYPGNKFKLEEVAKHAGVPGRTLRRWYLRENGAPPDKLVIEEKKALADRLEELAHKLVDVAFRIADDTDDVNIQQVSTSVGIIVDKFQLLKGKPTAIVDDASLTDEQRSARITTLLDTARARRDGRAADGYVQ